MKPHPGALERYGSVDEPTLKRTLAARDTAIIELNVIKLSTDLTPERKVDRLVEILQMMLENHVIPRPAS